jgi:CTP synthase (UTP-ammonia lyase)
MKAPAIALVGDYSAEVTAHRAIPKALELAASEMRAEVTWQWVRTREIGSADRDLANFAAAWLVPASPYENMDGAIDAVRWAREGRRPFLGTCGGFQHALIEIARNVAGIREAGHAEVEPGGLALVVVPLACSLVEETGAVHFSEGSRVRSAYGRPDSVEGYHCRYGLNARYRAALEAAGLRFTAWDDAGDVRAAELPAHPFFVGTLFQPERAALKGIVPPLVRAFLRATMEAA